MGNCNLRPQTINPGSVLDRVISQTSGDDECLLYKLANYKKGGELVDAYNVGGAHEVEKLVREQFGILMYREGKGQIISRTEYLRWKFRNTKHVAIPVEPSSTFDPLGKWEDHEACWQMQYRGSLGETLLHLLIICDTRLHTRLARILLRCYPKLAVDVVEGEEYLGASALHLAIAYSNNELVHLLVASGSPIELRAIGSFFLPRDQQRIPPSKTTDYEGLAYLGEYPLAWAACTNNETVYNLLLDHDADPDRQDSFGNMILHMVVVTDQLGMYGYALRHPKKCASNDIVNNQGLSPLTLACQLGRASVFREMLELSCKEFWRYSNITCSGYPLNALDTILPDGRTNWNSALFMILAGSKEEHLDMLDGGIIQRLLEEKWKTFALRQFIKRITIAFLHLLGMSGSVYLRPKDRTRSLTELNDAQDIIRVGFEVITVMGCLSYVIVQQGEEIKNQGLFSYIKQLPHAPPKALFLIANLLILSCIPFRMSGNVRMEESLLTFTMVFSWFFMMFFAGAIQLTGPFVTMVYSMIVGDMFTFSIIYAIFLLAFSQSFFYLYKGHPDQNSTLFAEFDQTWMAMYQMTLGSYNYADLSQLAYPNAAKTVFIIFMIMVPILLLNMLIAMMGNTYSQVIERSEKECIKQWAKIVVTLERAVSQEDAKSYIQEYSIKLSGTDVSNEVRGVMVIKSKNKTRAKQRKGAVANWKRVGKVTITALKRRKMTGEQMRQLMWGHRTSVCTPQQNVTPRQQSMEVEGLVNKDPMALDNAMSQLTFTNDLNFDLSQNILPASNAAANNKSALLGDNLSPKMAPVDGSSPKNKPPSPPSGIMANASAAPGINPRAGTQIPPPAYNTVVPGLGTSSRPAIKSARRRGAKIGLTPKIIIFSDKKDLIRVSLDSDESDDTEDVAHLSYDHRFHVKSKSSRRRSIAGDSVDLSSSRESLAADTEIDEGGGSQKSLLETNQKKTENTGKGITNAAFTLDEVEEIEVPKATAPKVSARKERPKSAKQKNKPNHVTISPEVPVDPTPQVPTGKHDLQASAVVSGKSNKNGKPILSATAGESKDKDMKASATKGGRPKSARPSSSSSSAAKKSGGKKQQQDKPAGGMIKKEEVLKEDEETPPPPPVRPHTAGIERWSTKEVQNMNELVAWERPEDDI